MWILKKLEPPPLHHWPTRGQDVVYSMRVTLRRGGGWGGVCVFVRRRRDSEKEAMRIFTFCLCDSHPNLIKLCVPFPLSSLQLEWVRVCVCCSQREAAAVLIGTSTKACSLTHTVNYSASLLSPFIPPFFRFTALLDLTVPDENVRRGRKSVKRVRTPHSWECAIVWMCVLAVIEDYLTLLNMRMHLQPA